MIRRASRSCVGMALATGTPGTLVAYPQALHVAVWPAGSSGADIFWSHRQM